MTSWKDKVILITGASSGIGAGTALQFARLGCSLSLNGRNEDKLKETVNKCIAAGLSETKILTIIGSVEDESTCKNIVGKTIEHFDHLDVLVNNAGFMVGGSIEEVSVEGFDNQMNVNVRSVFMLTQLAVPHLLKTKGNIVNVSSVVGLRAFPNIVAYCVSKAAVDQMTRCVALELAGRGVRVNAVNPGVIETNFHKSTGLTEEQYAKFLLKCKETHALGRPGTVDEVAKVITFLASDDASFITGETIAVDGGRHVMCPR